MYIGVHTLSHWSLYELHIKLFTWSESLNSKILRKLFSLRLTEIDVQCKSLFIAFHAGTPEPNKGRGGGLLLKGTDKILNMLNSLSGHSDGQLRFLVKYESDGILKTDCSKTM